MLAALLLSLLAAPQDHALASDVRFSSIQLTRGLSLTGGRIEIGHDWANDVFRVTVYDARRTVGEVHRTGVVSQAWFEELLAEVSDGLDRARPQTKSYGNDVYGLGTRVTLYHANRSWTNVVSGACERFPYFERSADELRTFAAVVRVIRERAELAAIEPGCILDSGFVAQVSAGEGRVLLAALEHVRRSPLAAAIDRRQIMFLRNRGRYEVRFRWRAAHVLDWSRKDAAYTVHVDSTTLATEGNLPPTPRHEGRYRYAYLDPHPDFPAPFRRLLGKDWIGARVTKEIAAVLGRYGERWKHTRLDGSTFGWPWLASWSPFERPLPKGKVNGLALMLEQRDLRRAVESRAKASRTAK